MREVSEERRREEKKKRNYVNMILINVMHKLLNIE